MAEKLLKAKDISEMVKYESNVRKLIVFIKDTSN